MARTIEHARRAAIVVAAGALAVAGVEIAANLSATSGLRALLVRHPEVSVASVSAEPLSGRLTLRDVRTRCGRIRITIGRLALPLGRLAPSLIGPAAAAEPPAQGGGVASAENVTITSGPTTFRIKRIDMTGTQLTSADLARIFEAGNREPIEARLKTLTASAVVVPEILVDDATAGSERHATISQVLLSGVVAGKVAAGSAGAIAFTAKDADQEIGMRVGTITALGIDLPQIARVFGTVRSDDAEPMRTLFESVTANGLEVTNVAKGSVLTIGALKETDVRGRPLKSNVLAGGQPVRPMTDAEKSVVVEDVTHSLAVGRFEATDLAAHDTTPGEVAAFGVAGLSLEGLGEGKVAKLGVRALHAEAHDMKIGVGTIEIGPFALPRPQNADAYATNAMVPSAATADIRQIDVDVLAHPDGGEPSHSRFTVAHAGFTSEGQPEEIPKTAKVAVDHFAFDLPPSPGQAQPLADMGYGHLDVSASLATRYEAGTRAFDVDKLTLNSAGMGTADLGLQLANVTRGVISSQPEIAKAAAFSILAKGLSLRLVNAGLIDRAIAWKAKQDGLDIDKEKAFLADFFGDKLPASLGQSANAKIVGTAIAKFVNDPKTLRIGIVSQSGLGVGSMAFLADPGLLIDTLEVKASANE